MKNAEQLKTEAVTVVRDLAQALGSTASKLEGSSDTSVVRLLREGSSRVERLGRSLDGRKVDELVRGAGDWARANPAVLIGGLLMAASVAYLATGSRRRQESNPQVDELGGI